MNMKLKHLLFFALISVISFSACSGDDNEPQGEEPGKEELVLVGIWPMGTDQETGRIPMSWDPFYWNYEDGKLIDFTPKYALNIKSLNVIEYTDQRFEATKNDSEREELVMNTVDFENGRIKNQTVLSRNYTNFLYSLDYNYNYDAEGYLQSVTGTQKNGDVTILTEMLLTWENGNIVKIESTERNIKTIYTYTYDNKEYIPMSDLCVYTPTSLYTPYPLKEFYNKLGKQNKNNVIEVNIEYPDSKSTSYQLMKITYETVLNEDGTIKQVNHTGAYYPHFSEPDQSLQTFKGLRTLFVYEPKNKE